MAGETTIVRHYALLIGVDFCPDESRPLKGCVRDVREIGEYLTRSQAAVDVRILTASPTEAASCSAAESPEQLATHANVVASLERIVSDASVGDFIYVHFSGHGTTLTPRAGGFSNLSTGDLALALLHQGVDATTVRYLRGSELAYHLHTMVENRLLVTLVLDCCFSGSVTRLKNSVRFLPYKPAIDAAYPPTPGKSLGAEDKAVRLVYRSASMRPNWLVDPRGYCILTACGPAEEAKELEVDGQHHGMLSYFLLQSFVKRGRVGGRLHHIYSHIRARFLEEYPEQNPMLYGNKRLCFFEDISNEFDAAPIPVAIARRSGCKLPRLEAGRAHGVCEADEFALWTEDPCDLTLRAKHDPVIVRVRHVDALRSDLESLDEQEPLHVAPGMTATALTRLSLRKYPVRVELRLACQDVWRTTLQERPSLHVQFLEDTNPDVPFSWYITILAQHSYEIRDASQRVIPYLPSSPYNLRENAAFILDIVQHLASFKLVQEIRNESPFGQSFDLRLLNTETGKTYMPGCLEMGQFASGCSHTGCVAVARENDVLEVSLKNTGPPKRTLYVHAYVMGANWEIENLIQGDRDVIPPIQSNVSKHFQRGTPGEWTKKIRTTVPKELRDRGEFQCEDTIKIFVTQVDTSFMTLELPEIGEAVREHRSDRDREPHDSGPEENWAVMSFRLLTSID